MVTAGRSDRRHGESDPEPDDPFGAPEESGLYELFGELERRHADLLRRTFEEEFGVVSYPLELIEAAWARLRDLMPAWRPGKGTLLTSLVAETLGLMASADVDSISPRFEVPDPGGSPLDWFARESQKVLVVKAAAEFLGWIGGGDGRGGVGRRVALLREILRSVVALTEAAGEDPDSWELVRRRDRDGLHLSLVFRDRGRDD